MFKILKGTAPTYLAELISLKVSLSSLRVYEDKLLLQEPKHDLNNKKNRRFSVAAPKLWNKLPLEVRQSESLAIFKIKMKTHLFSVNFNQNA